MIPNIDDLLSQIRSQKIEDLDNNTESTKNVIKSDILSDDFMDFFSSQDEGQNAYIKKSVDLTNGKNNINLIDKRQNENSGITKILSKENNKIFNKQSDHDLTNKIENSVHLDEDLDRVFNNKNKKINDFRTLKNKEVEENNMNIKKIATNSIIDKDKFLDDKSCEKELNHREKKRKILNLFVENQTNNTSMESFEKIETKDSNQTSDNLLSKKSQSKITQSIKRHSFNIVEEKTINKEETQFNTQSLVSKLDINYLISIKNDIKKFKSNVQNIKYLHKNMIYSCDSIIVGMVSSIIKIGNNSIKIILIDETDSIECCIVYEIFMNYKIKVGDVLELSGFSLWRMGVIYINIVDRNICEIY